MASAKVVCIPLRKTLSLKNLLIFRRVRWISNFKTAHHYSTSENDLRKPIKYTTSEASKMSFGREMGLEKTSNPDKLWYERYVVMVSLAIFLMYFCIFRDENDIDEIIRGNPEYQSDAVKLIELEYKLHYCKTNKLPTERLERKIEELKSRSGIH